MTSLTKNLQRWPKKFFSSADQKTGRSVWGFEQLSSTIGGGGMALVRQLTTAGFRPISKYEYIVARLLKCEKKLNWYLEIKFILNLMLQYFMH